MITKVAEISISYSNVLPITEQPIVISSRDSFNVFISHWNMDLISLQEEFKVLFLNRGNRVLGIYSLSKGGMTGTIVDAKLVMSVALKCAASGIILCHNHPSSTLRPSNNDKALTKKIQQGAQLLDIALLDHLIIAPEGYYSFADEGELNR